VSFAEPSRAQNCSRILLPVQRHFYGIMLFSRLLLMPDLSRRTGSRLEVNTDCTLG
jgi:hypothetical protein